MGRSVVRGCVIVLHYLARHQNSQCLSLPKGINQCKPGVTKMSNKVMNNGVFITRKQVQANKKELEL